MKRSTLYILLALIPIVLIIAITTVFSLNTDDTPSSNQTPEEQTSTPNRKDPETIAIEAAEIMTRWKPAEDLNRTAAEQRASDLMTDDLASSITVPERAASGAEWRDAAEQNATSQPSVQINKQTETQDGMVSVLASWQWVTEEGDVLGTDPDKRIYYFTFNDRGEIHDYTYETVRASQPPEKEN